MAEKLAAFYGMKLQFTASTWKRHRNAKLTHVAVVTSTVGLINAPEQRNVPGSEKCPELRFSVEFRGARVRAPVQHMFCGVVVCLISNHRNYYVAMTTKP